MAQLVPTIAALGAKIAAVATSSTGALLSAGGTILSTVGAIQQGNQAASMAKYQARLADKRANEELAAGIKKAQGETRAARLAISRARAVGAASGGGLDIELMADLEEEGTLRSMNAIWEGQTAYNDTKQQGAEALFTGKSKKRASLINAGSTLLGGGASLMEKYAPLKETNG